MKRKLVSIFTSLTLVVVLLATLCACGSTWSSIKSAYEKEGYKEFELTDTIKTAFGLSDEQTEEADAEIHFMTTADIKEDDDLISLGVKVGLAKSAIIWEYKNIDAVKKAYKEDLSETEQEKFDELWEEYQKSDYVNGNCVLIWGNKDIFKGTK